MSIKTELRKEFIGLRLRQEAGLWLIKGRLPIVTDTGTELDQFQVEIELPSGFPSAAPRVREAGSRIPRIADRHINPDGTACLFVADEQWRFWNEQTKLVDFIRGPVHQFFLGQIYYEEFQTWPFGQRAHGTEGIAEYYFEELQTTSLVTVVNFVKLLSVAKIHEFSMCYCGELRLLSHCRKHCTKVYEFRAKISAKLAQSSLSGLIEFAKNLGIMSSRSIYEVDIAKTLPLKILIDLRFIYPSLEPKRVFRTCWPEPA